MRVLFNIVAGLRAVSALRQFEQAPLHQVYNGIKDVARQQVSDGSFRVTDPAQLGVDSVKQHSGYFDFEHDNKHLFFWFFESRNDPKTDPVVLWINGGPGCSSIKGMFFEMGSAKVEPQLRLVDNPYAWNSNASVIYLDQPVNTGYSYSSEDHRVNSTRQAAKDVHLFLNKFFETYPEYAELDFHVAGESYAGHYIPAIATEIQSHREKNYELASVLIGNGVTDTKTQVPYFQAMACGEGGYPSVLSEDTCQQMKEAVVDCQELIDHCWANPKNKLQCYATMKYCLSVSVEPYMREGGRNAYDVRDVCSKTGCYEDENDAIESYLNDEHVQSVLGIKGIEHVGCRGSVGDEFALNGDYELPFQYDVADLLDSGLPVLLYSGDKDFRCNWLGNKAWSDKLEWKGAKEYSEAPIKRWHANVDGKDIAAGEVKQSGELTFLRVFDAGHMVPHDQPETSLDMLNRWISGGSFE